MENLRLPRLPRVSYASLLLLGILGLALGLRLYGIGWDSGHGYHPDERSIYMRADCMYDVLNETPGYEINSCYAGNPGMEPGIPGPSTFMDSEKSPLNPHWFPLGSILIYLLVLIRSFFELFGDFSSIQNMSYVGRTIAALADVGTVLMVYLVGKRVFCKSAGLLAAGFIALAVVHIQMSHFYRPEPLMVFFLLTSFWFMLRVMDRGNRRDSVFLGIFVGLTVATKVSVLPLVFPLILAYGFRAHALSEGSSGASVSHAIRRVMPHAVLGGCVALGAFFMVTPYALLDVSAFVGDQLWQAEHVAKTAGKVPFTVQYVGATPLLYEVRQTVVWGLGIPLGIVAWGGLLFTALRVFGGWSRFKGELLLLAWAVPTIILLAMFETKFLRYIFPVVPFLALMGSGMLFSILFWARKYGASAQPEQGVPLRGRISSLPRHMRRYSAPLVIGVMALVVGATGFYALAFETIYAQPHTAVQASRWINANIPPGTAILTDNHWDEPLHDLWDYDVTQFTAYDEDTVDKMDRLAQQLEAADYLAFYSNRTYGSIARLPDRYPLTSRYYQLLFSGNLGYRLERSFTSYPELLGVAFVDDTFGRAALPEPQAPSSASSAPVSLNLGYADENVTNYDHPRVLLFRNEEKLSHGDLVKLLAAETRPPLGLMLTPEQQRSRQEGGTFSEIIHKDSWTNKAPVLAWLLLVEVIYLTALPLSTFLFRPLPDRGITFARLLGILGVSYVAWLLASLEWLEFSRMSVLVGILVVSSLSALALVLRWQEFSSFIRRNWRLLVLAEVIFLAAFLAFVALRAANPDLWHFAKGGEKPMDFAYLNAVLRSTYMPPFDPWFAGGYLNYYYFGQFIVATLIHGTGIVPSVAYNLATPLLFALTVTAAYSLVFNITAGLRLLGLKSDAGGDAQPPDPSCTDDPRRGGGIGPGRAGLGPKLLWGPMGAGLAAALFVGVIGNLDGVAQVVKGAWDSTFHGSSFPSMAFLSDFWRSSRMIPDTPEVIPSALTFWLPGSDGNRAIGPHITEFPYFTFVFADLHAHLIAIPFTLLALGAALSLTVGLKGASWRWLICATVLLGATVGALWPINSWDYPTYLLLSVVLIGAAVLLKSGLTAASIKLFLVLAAVSGMVGVVAFLPFHMNYHPFPTGLDVSRWQTPITSFLGIHGLFLFLISTFLIYLNWDRAKTLGAGIFGWAHATYRSWKLEEAPFPKMSWPVRLSWSSVVWMAGSFVVVYLAVAHYWTSAFLALLLLMVCLAIKDAAARRDESRTFVILVLALTGTGLLVALGVEFVRIQDDIGRMNTLFKFYVQVWALLALASACILWRLGDRGFFRIKGMTLVRVVWLVALGILVGSSFFYTILGTGDRLATRFDTDSFTLDGAQYMTTTIHTDWTKEAHLELIWDYEAIGWLQDNLQGSPVILEAHTDQYHWGARIANYTGLPTVLGWPWHQTQQRMKYAYAVQERGRDVAAIYSTDNPAEALELLRKYQVKYVVVGQLEHAYYPPESLRKFDDWVGEGHATVVYENPSIKIYQGLWYN